MADVLPQTGAALIEDEPFDLLKAPLAGIILRNKTSRTLIRLALLIVSVMMIVHGLLGPALAPKNLATTLGWVHFRGVLILALLCAGNFFCYSCPFILVRDFARKFFRPVLNWPRPLRNKWLPIGLLVAVLFCYERFALWSKPWWTAWLIIGYFATALVVDSVFRHASFCKYVCPIGQFNFVAAMVSPFEVSVRDRQVCSGCGTLDCIKGRRETQLVSISAPVKQRGCELALFQPGKASNMDCTFCLDCVYACPHDNVGIISRPATSILSGDPARAGIGRFSQRKDISALLTVFTFGALLNAFGMVTPVYAFEYWLNQLLHLGPGPILGLIFAGFLILEPVMLMGAAAQTMKTLTRTSRSLVAISVRYSYGLVPLGFGMWLAHYSFHLLTGLFTIVPVLQSALADAGIPFLGDPLWRLTGIPVRVVQPIQLGMLVLALAGAMIWTHTIAEEDQPEETWRAFAPWAVVNVLIWAAAVWLVLQPMDMRGTFLAS
jgi:ferredoxin